MTNKGLTLKNKTMRCSNFYNIVKQVKQHEQKELEVALKAWGGSFDFDAHPGIDRPIIAVNMDNCEPEPQDVYVNSVTVDEDGYLTLQCTGKLDGEDYKVEPDDVFAGHLEYVIGYIPETEKVKDVTIPFVLG